jgi:integrase/recombinase XerD
VPDQVRPADVLAFITAQRTGRAGERGVPANPVPRGLPARRERSRPRQGVPPVRVTRQLPRILSPAAVDALTAAVRTYRDRAMVAAMVLGGLRRCEVRGLRLGDLRVAERGAFIAGGKGGRQRLVRLPGRFLPRWLPVWRASGRRKRSGVRGLEGAAPRPAAVGQGDR